MQLAFCVNCKHDIWDSIKNPWISVFWICQVQVWKFSHPFAGWDAAVSPPWWASWLNRLNSAKWNAICRFGRKNMEKIWQNSWKRPQGKSNYQDWTIIKYCFANRSNNSIDTSRHHPQILVGSISILVGVHAVARLNFRGLGGRGGFWGPDSCINEMKGDASVVEMFFPFSNFKICHISHFFIWSNWS